MAVSKTRAKLVDVARQLFAKNGVDDTTMNDIAVASKKGRRTLYTYFKSKEDIYMAVVESELEMLSGAMEKVAEQDIAPDTKGVAIALNGTMLPRAEWIDTKLNANDRIEIVHARQGG